MLSVTGSKHGNSSFFHLAFVFFFLFSFFLFWIRVRVSISRISAIKTLFSS